MVRGHRNNGGLMLVVDPELIGGVHPHGRSVGEAVAAALVRVVHEVPQAHATVPARAAEPRFAVDRVPELQAGDRQRVPLELAERFAQRAREHFGQVPEQDVRVPAARREDHLVAARGPRAQRGDGALVLSESDEQAFLSGDVFVFALAIEGGLPDLHGGILRPADEHRGLAGQHRARDAGHRLGVAGKGGHAGRLAARVPDLHHVIRATADEVLASTLAGKDAADATTVPAEHEGLGCGDLAVGHADGRHLQGARPEPKGKADGALGGSPSREAARGGGLLPGAEDRPVLHDGHGASGVQDGNQGAFRQALVRRQDRLQSQDPRSRQPVQRLGDAEGWRLQDGLPPRADRAGRRRIQAPDRAIADQAPDASLSFSLRVAGQLQDAFALGSGGEPVREPRPELLGQVHGLDAHGKLRQLQGLAQQRQGTRVERVGQAPDLLQLAVLVEQDLLGEDGLAALQDGEAAEEA
mmetsp:Transcript_14911/g.56567  ORF Transcript_14911/g.56567 Transcript_14911/m.56567 type:complete len:469 (+) Transcript_14911:1352-2758(+)